MAKVTIEDISRYTGLSRGTVSRALNDRSDIAKHTKQRVMEAVDVLHYTRNFTARSLATGRSFAVAVLIEDLQSVFAASFLRGALAQARSAQYAAYVAELGTEPQQQRDSILALVNERIDCVLVGTTASSTVASVLRESLEDRPAVACAPLEGIDCDLLVPDQAESGRLAARHLLGNGARALLYVHTPDAGGTGERLAGFQEVCRESGLDPGEITLELPAERPITQESRNRIVGRLEGVEAIAATDDLLAVELMAMCLRAGRVPGDDVAIIGQGNEPVGGRITPTLTTTDFNGEEIGRRAMETTLARLAKKRMDAPQSARVPPTLIARESTQLHR